MSLQNLSCNAAFLTLFMRGRITTLEAFAADCKFKLTDQYTKGESFTKSLANVQSWAPAEREQRLFDMLEELELKDEDLINI